MGQLFIPAEKKIKGPWFLGKNELEELDPILLFVEEEIMKSADFNSEQEAKYNIQKGYDKDFSSALAKIKARNKEELKKKVTLISKDATKLVDQSVLGILKDSKIKDFRPKELKVDISVGYNNQFSLVIERRYDGELSYSVACSSQDCQEEIKYQIENWVEKHKPNKVKQAWNSYALVIGMLGMLFLFFTSTYYISTDRSAKEYYKQETIDLLKVGVNNTNQAKATELLLKISADYTPPEAKESLSYNKLFKILAVCVCFLLLAVFHPKTTIGIGKHKPLLKIYRIYTTFILITIPSVLIIPPLIEWLQNVIGI